MKHKYKIILALISCIVLAGCGSSGKQSMHSDMQSTMDSAVSNSAEGIEFGLSYDSSNYGASYAKEVEGYEEIIYDDTKSYSNDAYENNNNSTNKSSTSILDSVNKQKLIYSANLTVETLEFNEAIECLDEQVGKYNGIVENKSFDDNGYWDYNSGYRVLGERTLNTVIRIPTNNYDKFMDEVNTLGNIVVSNSRVDNITKQYYDTKAYLESYENQLSVLQGMYSKAKTIDEMIKVESRISEVQAEILKLKTEIQSMDMDVAYSTVDLQIKEVIKYSDNPNIADQRTFIDRVILECKDSWDSFIYFLESVLMWFISSIWKIGLLIGAVWVYVRFFRNRLKKRIGRLGQGNTGKFIRRNTDKNKE